MKLALISGAHHSGKTTLIYHCRKVFTTTTDEARLLSTLKSCSTALFNTLSVFGLQTYDDIDAMNLREFFQASVPYVWLDNLVTRYHQVHVEQNIAISDEVKQLESILLVDRWLPDIYAYNQSELENQQLRQHYNQILEALYPCFIDFCLQKDIRFFPIVLEPIPITDDTKKNRATIDQQQVHQYIIEWHQKRDLHYHLIPANLGLNDRMAVLAELLTQHEQRRN